CPRIHFHALGRDPTPVAVVADRAARPGVIGGGLHAAGYERARAIGADDDPRALGHRPSAPSVTANAGHAAAVPDQVLHRERLTQFGPGLDRGFDQQRVEHRPTRAVALAHAARCWRQAPQREWADVEPDARDRRAARGPDLLEQAPTLES